MFIICEVCGKKLGQMSGYYWGNRDSYVEVECDNCGHVESRGDRLIKKHKKAKSK